MSHFSFELSLLAIILGLLLCGDVFHKDRIEKEPGELLALLLVGAVAYIPVHFAQKLIIKLIDKLFQNDVRL